MADVGCFGKGLSVVSRMVKLPKRIAGIIVDVGLRGWL